IRRHTSFSRDWSSDVCSSDLRVVMRMVVVLFAESRELLPRDNALYHGSYGLAGLLEELEKVDARGGARLRRSWNAWPRVLSLFQIGRASCRDIVAAASGTAAS